MTVKNKSLIFRKSNDYFCTERDKGMS